MDSYPEFIGLGFTARSHGYWAVERAKMAENRVLGTLSRAGPGISYFVLSTCSRLEAILGGPRDSLDGVFDAVRKTLKDHVSSEPSVYKGYGLVDHVLRVFSGMESPALFEIDVASQAKASLRDSLSRGSVNKALYVFIREAIDLSIDLRRSLGLDGSIGIPELSVMAVREALGDLDGLRISIVGTGEVGRRVASYLKRLGLNSISIIGRSRTSAESLAKLLGLSSAYSLEELGSVIGASDLLFLATSSRDPIVGRHHIDGWEGVIVDLGMPRNTDPSLIPDLQGSYMWLEDLEILSTKILADLYSLLPKAEELLRIYSGRLQSIFIIERIREALRDYARLYEEIRRREIDRAIEKLGLGERDREILDLVTSSIMNKALGALGSIVERGVW